MNIYELFCGNALIVAGGESLDADCQQITYGLDIIEKCLSGVCKGKYQILGDGDQILSLFKEDCNYVEAAGGYVLNNVGQSLVIYRNGLWDLPKGRVEDGENIEQAAIREVMEETGIKNTPTIVRKLVDTFHFYRWKSEFKLSLKRTSWYLMDYKGDSKTAPQEEEGITAALWVDDGMIDDMINKTHRNLKMLFEFKKDGRI